MLGFVKRRWPWIVVLLLALSIAGNVSLVFVGLSYFARELQVRLDPTGRRLIPWQASAVQGTTQPGAKTSVVYIGDSRIAMWTDPPGPADMRVLNRGIGDESSAQLLLRLDQDALAERPAVVVIQSGGNDLKAIGLLPAERDEIVRNCIDHLRQIVEKTRATGAKVVLTTIWPFGQPDLQFRLIWSEDTNTARAEVNQELLTWKIDGVQVIDCDNLLAQSGHRIPALGPDHLHLNAAGYQAIRTRIADAVNRAAR